MENYSDRQNKDNPGDYENNEKGIIIKDYCTSKSDGSDIIVKMKNTGEKINELIKSNAAIVAFATTVISGVWVFIESHISKGMSDYFGLPPILNYTNYESIVSLLLVAIVIALAFRFIAWGLSKYLTEINKMYITEDDGIKNYHIFKVILIDILFTVVFAYFITTVIDIFLVVSYSSTYNINCYFIALVVLYILWAGVEILVTGMHKEKTKDILMNIRPLLCLLIICVAICYYVEMFLYMLMILMILYTVSADIISNLFVRLTSKNLSKKPNKAAEFNKFIVAPFIIFIATILICILSVITVESFEKTGRNEAANMSFSLYKEYNHDELNQSPDNLGDEKFYLILDSDIGPISLTVNGLPDNSNKVIVFEKGKYKKVNIDNLNLEYIEGYNIYPNRFYYIIKVVESILYENYGNNIGYKSFFVVLIV